MIDIIQPDPLQITDKVRIVDKRISPSGHQIYATAELTTEPGAQVFVKVSSFSGPDRDLLQTYTPRLVIALDQVKNQNAVTPEIQKGDILRKRAEELRRDPLEDGLVLPSHFQIDIKGDQVIVTTISPLIREARSFQAILESPQPRDNLTVILRKVAVILDTLEQVYKVKHGDIRPDNILIDANGNVFLIDFSLAQLFELKATIDPSPESFIALYEAAKSAGLETDDLQMQALYEHTTQLKHALKLEPPQSYARLSSQLAALGL